MGSSGGGEDLFVFAYRPLTAAGSGWGQEGAAETYCTPPFKPSVPEPTTLRYFLGTSLPRVCSERALPSSLQVPGTTQEALYLTGRVAGVNTQILLEIRLMPSVPGLDVSFKSERADLATLAFDAVAQILA